MNTQPKYAENIIVGVKLNSDFKWYVSDKEFWYLDLRKLINAYESKGFKIPNSKDFSGRFNIDIVNSTNTDLFINSMSRFIAKSEELSNLIKEMSDDEIVHLVPSIYIDFDKRILISNFPEPASFELFIPDGWCGRYDSFNELIPSSYRYWIIDDKNYMEKHL